MLRTRRLVGWHRWVEMYPCRPSLRSYHGDSDGRKFGLIEGTVRMKMASYNHDAVRNVVVQTDENGIEKPIRGVHKPKIELEWLLGDGRNSSKKKLKQKSEEVRQKQESEEVKQNLKGKKAAAERTLHRKEEGSVSFYEDFGASKEAKMLVADVDVQLKVWTMQMTLALQHVLKLPKKARLTKKEQKALDRYSMELQVLAGFDPAHIAALAVEEAVSTLLNASDGSTVLMLAIGIGNRVWKHFDERNKSTSLYGDTKLAKPPKVNHPELDRITKARALALGNEIVGDKAALVRVGAFLMKLLTDNCYVHARKRKNMSSPRYAFEHFMERDFNEQNQFRNTGMVRINPLIQCKCFEENSPQLIVSQNRPLDNPMLARPKEWTNTHDGGHQLNHSQLLRVRPQDRSQLKVFDITRPQAILDGVNLLGSVPWSLNEDVYSLAADFFSQEGKDFGLPGTLPVIDKEAIIKTIKEGRKKTTNKKNQDDSVMSSRKAKRLYQQYMSKRLDFHSRLKLGAYVIQKGEEIFYFPHSMDTRGRCYPITPISYMGDDLARSLLLFGEARPLGKRGYYWLKVHLANHFGVDKIPLNQRATWSESNMDKIRKAAADPSNDMWWRSADKPWQALATIKEIAAAESDPENYRCALPVHLDGSCNGLQHFAALGRDKVGGEQVNLVKRDLPGDPYTTVAKEVMSMMDARLKELEDKKPKIRRIRESLRTVKPVWSSEKSDENKEENSKESWENKEENSKESEENKEKESKAKQNTQMEKDAYEMYLIKRLRHNIDRKLVKQTVMTTVYGVTFIGARQQIKNRLQEKKIFDQDQHADALEHSAATYLASLTLQAIGRKFKAATECKQWLQETAKLVAHAGEPVRWVTPLGLPVIQPYRLSEKESVSTCLQNVIIQKVTELNPPIDKRKHQSAFPPNYVHSLDSTHMLMTALECEKHGILFTAVHDSFWCHPSNVDQMGKILREKFVELHGPPLLMELKDQTQAMFPQFPLKDPPFFLEQDEIDEFINGVKDSEFFFS